MKPRASAASTRQGKGGKAPERSANSADNKNTRRARWFKAAIAAAVLAASYGGWHYWTTDVSPALLLTQARDAIAAKDYAAAEEYCLQLIVRQGPTPAVLFMAAEAASQQGRLEEALGYYALIPPEAGEDAALGCAAAGQVLLQMRHASAAEAQFRRALEIDPTLLSAHEQLAHLLSIEGRRFESLEHLFALVRGDRLTSETLILLGNHAAVLDRSDELKQFRQAAPDDFMPLLGAARLAIRHTRPDEARRLLEQVLAQAPNQIEAQAELGQILYTEGGSEFTRWLLEAAPAAEAHPDVWMTRGLWAKQRKDTRGAARCFWEALERDPLHQAAAYQLAQEMTSLGEAKAAQELGERAAQLERLARLMDLLYVNHDNPRLLREAAELTESLGCIWEACAWRKLILKQDPQGTTNRQVLARLIPLLEQDTPLVLNSANPAKRLNLSDFPLPHWQDTSGEPARAAELALCRISFADIASQAGLDFAFSNGSQSEVEDKQVFRVMGAGVAVFDYDADGWPDIYFTQGRRAALEPTPDDPRDRLFRNRGDGTFEDVTERALLAEDRFSQGVAIGDVNSDGFPDLYIANIGANRLYINQQDGTFRDATDEAGVGDESWTSSCVLADFNGDGLCDIYDANYIEGPGVYEKICPQGGRPRTCAAAVFQSQADRFYLNLGDGRFADQTASAGVDVAGGNGLGVVAGDLDGSGRLSLFVANDQDANFCLTNETAGPGEPTRFIERGVVTGLAYDAEGKALACMGVAAGDVNEDGRLDLFVTNFYEESNTLYLQQDGGMFLDATGPSGLQVPGYLMLGFGTQFLDADLDGHLDLAVANGHIEDMSFRNIPYRMRPQFFRGLGDGRFQELPAAELGEFFQGEHLGRGLARIDWNRDGRDDFVISHLNEPAALLSNTTDNPGHFLSVQLRGVQSSRDAIGARVTVTAGGRSRIQWLLGGDGYQANNQRQLIFGLGPEERIDKLDIRWPSGLTQEFPDLSTDQELIFIEGSPRATRLPPHTSSPADRELQTGEPEA